MYFVVSINEELGDKTSKNDGKPDEKKSDFFQKSLNDNLRGIKLLL